MVRFPAKIWENLRWRLKRAVANFVRKYPSKLDIFCTPLASFGQCQISASRRRRKTNRVSGNPYSSSSFDWLCFWGSGGHLTPRSPVWKCCLIRNLFWYWTCSQQQSNGTISSKTVSKILKVVSKALQIAHKKVEVLQWSESRTVRNHDLNSFSVSLYPVSIVQSGGSFAISINPWQFVLTKNNRIFRIMGRTHVDPFVPSIRTLFFQ